MPLRDNRTALRLATRRIHDQAEAHWSGAPLAEFLARMYRVHRSLGLAAAERSGLASALAEEQARIAALEHDLAPGAPPDPAPLSSRDAAWGVLYALNGSALGASVLLKEAAGAEHPSAYLTVMRDYARSGGLRTFFDALNREPLDQAAAKQGAAAVFAALTLHHPSEGDAHDLNLHR